MMNEIKVAYLETGIAGLVKHSFDLFRVPFVGFSVGDAAGFVPSGHERGVVGQMTYQGGREHLRVKVSNDDRDLSIQMLIPEEFTDVQVGNIVLYVNLGGSLKPAVIIVFPEIVHKRDPFPESTRNVGFNYPANRLVVGLMVRMIDATELTNDVVLNVVQPAFSNLPMFGNLEDVPTPALNPHRQFVVNRTGSRNEPALVVKGHDDEYWTTPLWQNMYSPKYGVINDFERSRDIWVWGGVYIGPSPPPDHVIGGGSYADTGDMLTIGGGSYTGLTEN